jgi:PIN domain nuclease of toxin-antitoxin system
VRLLLDTHVYLWWLLGDRRLGAARRRAIADQVSEVYVSAASIWELAIKISIGRFEPGEVDLAEQVEASGFRQLPVTGAHAWRGRDLPPLHRDPFDRMLVAQALSEGLTLATDDPAIRSYAVPVL